MFVVEIKRGDRVRLVTPSSPMQNSIRGLIDEIFKLPIPRRVSGLRHAAHSNDNASTSVRASSFFLELTPFPPDVPSLVIEKIGEISRNRRFVEGVIDANDVNLHTVMKARRTSFPFYVTFILTLDKVHVSCRVAVQSRVMHYKLTVCFCQTRHFNFHSTQYYRLLFSRTRSRINVQ